jgi:dipeptidyl aminopeptidase/acylaminoacyl peptidase
MHRPFGSWSSPISAAMVASQGLRLNTVRVDDGDIYWVEGRPDEAGRNVVVCRSADGRTRDLNPAPFNVRTRVHEYGGGAYAVAAGDVCFSNFSDQRLYRLSAHDASPPRPLTPAGEWRFADAVVDSSRHRLVCVREDHTTGQHEPITTLVAVSLDDGNAHAGDVLVAGYDFYSSPRLSADGGRLAWLCWRHPHMPWDETELWVAEVSASGALMNARCVAGGSGESIYQPGWLPDGSLCFASDRDEWWRLYRLVEGTGVVPILTTPPARTEFGRPEWVFGTATWASAAPGTMVTAFTRDGRWHLGTIDIQAGTLRELPTALEPQEWLTATPTHALLVGASPTRADAVVRVDLTSGACEVLRSSAANGATSSSTVDPAVLSTPEAITFPTTSGARAHAFYYAPRNQPFEGHPGEQPPLIVIGHGGPTTATRDTLDLKVQFWTSRGFAVADVNYRGSSGYGRPYRRGLNGQWGIADVDDMVHVARFLVEAGKADPRRLIIRGGSAGGYTTLATLTFHPGVFQAGASYYGISDLEVLARDTHKFESRYLDSLVGPYPETRDTYRARSPIHFIDRLSCALILFQGLDDKVVPPNQSGMMADAVRGKGLPVSYLTFAGEQHGFRRADTIVRCLEAELYFYGAVFGFAIADRVDPPPIDNLPSPVPGR